MRRLWIAGIVFSLLLVTTPVQAQIEPGVMEIWQNGQLVGEIFVPERQDGRERYVEHWILFKGYVYPGQQSKIVTEIRPSAKTYASEEEFFRKAPWGGGHRYVRVDSTDSDRLPGRPGPKD